VRRGIVLVFNMIIGFQPPAPRRRATRGALAILALASLLLASGAFVRTVSAVRDQPPPAPVAPVVERLGKDLFRLGKTRVNTATREVSVTGTINPVSVLEFLANPPRGLKAYESALTLDTDGITFNTGLVLIGLERTHARLLPNRTVDGDHVELWVEIPGPPPRRMRAERLVFDRATNQEMPETHWIYTGSMFLENGRYLADTDGVLIGFVQNRAAIIERPQTLGIGRYGSVVLNPNLGLQPGMTLTLTVKAIAPPTGAGR
jgi:hypothetical protein